MLGYPKKFDVWLASGPIAITVFSVSLAAVLWGPGWLVRIAIWGALLPLLAVLAALLFAALGGLIARVFR